MSEYLNDQQYDWLPTTDFTQSEWTEVADLTSPGTFNISRTASSATVYANLPWERTQACITYLLGYSVTLSPGNDSDEYRLHRVPPVKHPYFPWLWCSNVANAVGKGPIVPNPDGIINPNPNYNTINYGYWDRVLIAANFSTIDYYPAVDGGVEFEYQRWTKQTARPYTEIFVLGNGTYKFDAPAVPEIDGKPVNSPQTVVKQQKNAIDFTWYEVPYDWITDEDGDQPKLSDIQKKVNTTTFLNKAPGTLLCESVEVIQDVQPLANAVVGKVAFTCKVVFKFIEFDPPLGTGVTMRGWNLWPHVTGKYYPAKTSAGVYAYESYEFADAFKHWST